MLSTHVDSQVNEPMSLVVKLIYQKLKNTTFSTSYIENPNRLFPLILSEQTIYMLLDHCVAKFVV